MKGTSVIYIVKIPVKDHCIFFCEGKRHRKRYCKAKLVGKETHTQGPAQSLFLVVIKIGTAMLDTGDWEASKCYPGSR